MPEPSDASLLVQWSRRSRTRSAWLFGASLVLGLMVTARGAEAPEDRLACAGESARRSEPVPPSRPFTREMPGTITRAMEHSRLRPRTLLPEDQARLDAAGTREKLQALVVELMRAAEGGGQRYTLSGATGCAITKHYSDPAQSESVCLASDGIHTGYLGSTQDGCRVEGDAPANTLYVRCASKRCAVVTQGATPEFLDSYFFGAMFPDERRAVLAASALGRLARACAAQ